MARFERAALNEIHDETVETGRPNGRVFAQLCRFWY